MVKNNQNFVIKTVFNAKISKKFDFFGQKSKKKLSCFSRCFYMESPSSHIWYIILYLEHLVYSSILYLSFHIEDMPCFACYSLAPVEGFTFSLQARPFFALGATKVSIYAILAHFVFSSNNSEFYYYYKWPKNIQIYYFFSLQKFNNKLKYHVNICSIPKLFENVLNVNKKSLGLKICHPHSFAIWRD